MDQCKEKRDAVEVNAAVVDVDDVSSPKAKEKESVDLEAESLLAMAVIRKQLNGIPIGALKHLTSVFLTLLLLLLRTWCEHPSLASITKK